jgi:hypothetical protein
VTGQQPLRHREPGQRPHPDDADRIQGHHDAQHKLTGHAVVDLHIGVVEQGQPQGQAHRDAHHDLGTTAGGPALCVHLAAHVQLFPDRTGQRAQQVPQARAAQLGIDHQRGDDEVGAGISQVVGEPAQRLGHGNPGVQPFHQGRQRVTERGCGGPQ